MDDFAYLLDARPLDRSPLDAGVLPASPYRPAAPAGWSTVGVRSGPDPGFTTASRCGRVLASAGVRRGIDPAFTTARRAAGSGGF
jgi:hypothetical protein